MWSFGVGHCFREHAISSPTCAFFHVWNRVNKQPSYSGSRGIEEDGRPGEETPQTKSHIFRKSYSNRIRNRRSLRKIKRHFFLLSHLRDAACPHMLHASVPVAPEFVAVKVWDASSGLSEWRSYQLKQIEATRRIISPRSEPNIACSEKHLASRV